MTGDWIRLRYRDFHDIPRAFLVEYAGEPLFFDCSFDEVLDDYRNEYIVYRVPDGLRDQMDTMPWTDIADSSDRIGTVRTDLVKFDASGRRAICADVFELLETTEG